MAYFTNKRMLSQEQLTENKPYIVAVNFDVKLDDEGIEDASKIDVSIPTIFKLLEAKAKSLHLFSHLGRPKGHDPHLSMKIVAEYVAHKLHTTVEEQNLDWFENYKRFKLQVNDQLIYIYENTRFLIDFKKAKKDEQMRWDIANPIYDRIRDEEQQECIAVNDAFPSHNPEFYICELLKRCEFNCGGLYLEEEVNHLGKIMTTPKENLIAIMGGGPKAEKITLMEKIIPRVSALLVGGSLAYSLLKNRPDEFGGPIEIGKSLYDESLKDTSRNLFNIAKENGTDLMLPADHIEATDLHSTKDASNTEGEAIHEDKAGFDIGTETILKFITELEKFNNGEKVIGWNGPMGVFETHGYDRGTDKILEYLTKSTKAQVILGGGDTTDAVKHMPELLKEIKNSERMHMSLAGGASLRFFEGTEHIGVLSLSEK